MEKTLKTKQLLQEKEVKSAILALIENFANTEENPKNNNLGYDCMEKYGRFQALFEIVNQLQLEFMIMKNDNYYEFMDYDFKINKEFIEFVKNY